MEWDEQAVLLGCQQGNARCQELLFKHFYGRVKGICLRYAARPDEAKDLLQESFLKVYQNIGLFRGDSSLTTWISRITVNHCVSHFRKNKNTQTEELNNEYAEEEEELETEELNPEQVIELIQKLPEGYRQVLNLYAIDGHSHQEIADLMGISSGTSKSQLSKARKMLRGMISQLANSAIR